MLNAEYITTIICESAEREDTAKYTISVNNDHGSDSADIELVVLGRLFLVVGYFDEVFYANKNYKHTYTAASPRHCKYTNQRHRDMMLEA